MELGNYKDTRSTLKAMGLMTLIIGITLVITAKDKEVAKMLASVISLGALSGVIEAYLERRGSEYTHASAKSNAFLLIVEDILLAVGLFTLYIAVATAVSLVKFFSPKLALVIGLVVATYIMLVIVAKEIINIIEEYIHKKGIK